MIINYWIPFSNNRKLARSYCKIVLYIKRPFVKRKLLKHYNAGDINYRDIPIVINNYNRLDYLQKQIDWLEKAGQRHIYIIDNASTNPQLIDYYKNTPHTVIKLTANIGYKALWDTCIHLWFKGLPYVYTDPDILPVDNCPHDAVNYFHEILKQQPHINKVGFALKIDDIPNYYPQKKEVIKWETKFWDNPISTNLYKADIDTTFALYRANSIKQQYGKTIRTGGDYIARHLPWYENPTAPSQEELFYRENAIGSYWYANKMTPKT